jgi:hypothetical protein
VFGEPLMEFVGVALHAGDAMDAKTPVHRDGWNAPG